MREACTAATEKEKSLKDASDSSRRRRKKRIAEAGKAAARAFLRDDERCETVPSPFG